MINVELDARILEDQKFNAQVEDRINEFREIREKARMEGRQLKASPTLRLLESGRLKLSFILSEFPKIASKESQLPRGERDAIANIVFEAARRVVLLNQQERAQKTAQKANDKAAKE